MKIIKTDGPSFQAPSSAIAGRPEITADAPQVQNAGSLEESISVRPEEFKPDFKDTINIDWKIFQAQVKKSLQTKFQPLVDPKKPNDFRVLFEQARQTFQNDVEPGVLDTIKPHGEIFTYCKNKETVFQPMNELFGFIKTQDLSVRKEILNALFLLPRNELNCPQGMVERIYLIHRAALGNQSLINQAFEESAGHLLFKESAGHLFTGHLFTGEIHSNYAAIQGAIESPALKPFVEKHFEAFLGNVTHLINDLKDAIAKTDDTAQQVENIRAMQEKHVGTVSLLFSARKTTADEHAVSDQLHQKSAYFELDENTFCYKKVKAEAILTDALSQMVDILNQISKIKILHKNPALATDPLSDEETVLWKSLIGSISTDEIKLTGKSPQENLDELLAKHILPQQLTNSEFIKDLFKFGILTPEKLLNKVHGQPCLLEALGRAAVPKNAPLVASLIWPQFADTTTYAESFVFQKMYCTAMFGQNKIQLKQLEDMALVQPHIDPLKRIHTAYTKLFENCSIKGPTGNKLEEVKSALNRLDKSIQGEMLENVLTDLMHRFSELPDEQRLPALGFISSELGKAVEVEGNPITSKAANALCSLLKAIRPIEQTNREQAERARDQYTKIFEIVRLFSDPYYSSDTALKLKCDDRLLVLAELVNIMPHLPAGTLLADKAFIKGLFQLGIITPDTLLNKADGHPCLLEQLGRVADHAESAIFQMVYGMSMFGKSPAQREQLEKIDSISPHIENLKSSEKEYESIFTNAVPAENIINKIKPIEIAIRETDDFLGTTLRSTFLEGLCNRVSDLRDEHKPPVLAFIRSELASTYFYDKRRSAPNAEILRSLLKTIRPIEQPDPAQKQNTLAQHAEIFKIIDLYISPPTRGGVLQLQRGDHLSVLFDLMKVMPHLPAATLKDSTLKILQGGLHKDKNLQTRAYKLVKRNLEYFTAEPQRQLELITALCSNDVLGNLSTAMRTLSQKHYKKIVTWAITNGLLYGATHGLAEPAVAAMDTYLATEIASAEKAEALAKSAGKQPDAALLYLSAADALNQTEVVRGLTAAPDAFYLLGKKESAVRKVYRGMRKEFNEWGPFGALRTLRTVAHAIQHNPLASVQRATIRLSVASLIGIRSRLSEAERQRLRPELQNAWKALLSKASALPQASVDESTPAPPLEGAAERNTNDAPTEKYLAKRDQVSILSQYLHEFTPEHFPGVDAEVLRAERRELLDNLPAQWLVDLLPDIYTKNKVAYQELAVYLLERDQRSREQPSSSSAPPWQSLLTEQQHREIAANQQKIAGPLGKLTRLKTRTALLQTRNAILGALLGTPVAQQRTQEIRTARQEQIDDLKQKTSRIAEARKTLTEQFKRPSENASPPRPADSEKNGIMGLFRNRRPAA
jgi:hypothetical protein